MAKSDPTTAPRITSSILACASTPRDHLSRRRPIRFVDVIATGSVKVTRLSREGSEMILRVERAGSPVDGLGAHYEPYTRHPRTPCAIVAFSVGMPFEIVSLAAPHPILQRNAALVMTRRLQLLQDSFCDLSTARVP